MTIEQIWKDFIDNEQAEYGDDWMDGIDFGFIFGELFQECDPTQVWTAKGNLFDELFIYWANHSTEDLLGCLVWATKQMFHLHPPLIEFEQSILAEVK